MHEMVVKLLGYFDNWKCWFSKVTQVTLLLAFSIDHMALVKVFNSGNPGGIFENSYFAQPAGRTKYPSLHVNLNINMNLTQLSYKIFATCSRVLAPQTHRHSSNSSGFYSHCKKPVYEKVY